MSRDDIPEEYELRTHEVRCAKCTVKLVVIDLRDPPDPYPDWICWECISRRDS